MSVTKSYLPAVIVLITTTLSTSRLVSLSCFRITFSMYWYIGKTGYQLFILSDPTLSYRCKMPLTINYTADPLKLPLPCHSTLLIPIPRGHINVSRGDMNIGPALLKTDKNLFPAILMIEISIKFVLLQAEKHGKAIVSMIS